MVPLYLAAGLFFPSSAAGADCTLQTQSYIETFSDPPFGPTANFDYSVSNTPGWGTRFAIGPPNKQGAFQPSDINSGQEINERILAAAEGKVAALADRLPFVYVTDTNGCQLKFRRYEVFPPATQTEDEYQENYSQVLTNNPNLTDAVLIDASASCAPGVAIATAPVDITVLSTGAVLADVVVITPSYANFEGTVGSAYLYLNSQQTDSVGNPTGFSKVDISSILKQAGVSFHGGSPIMMSDIDGDGRPDLLVASSTGTTDQLLVFYADPVETYPYSFHAFEVLIADLGFQGPFASSSNPVTGYGFCATSSSMVSRGATGIAIKDLDGDGLKDVFVTSASEPNVHVFWGTSETTFARGLDIVTPAGIGVSRVFAQDFTGENVGDALVALAGDDCGTQTPYGILFRGDGNRTFTTIGPNLRFDFNALDWATTSKQYLDPTIYGFSYLYNYSLIMGPSEPNGMTFSYGNFPNLVQYNAIRARAQSRSLTRFLPNAGTLVDLTLPVYGFGLEASSSGQGFGTGTLSVSADNGQHWELLANAGEFEPSAPINHSFSYMGTDLLWRIDFSLPPLPSASMAASNVYYAYAPLSEEPMAVRGIKFTYTIAPPTNTSHSQVAYGPATATLPEMAFTANFDIPAFTGHLVALPLTTATVGNASTLTAVSVAESWDAGKTVAATAVASRTLYASIRPTTSGKTLSNADLQTYGLARITLTATNLDATQANGQTLRQTLQIPSTAPGVVSAQLTAIRAGADPNGQVVLRDSGHSSPVFVGSPNQDANYMANGYASFASQQAARAPFVLLGHNDGMVHAYEAASGQELWGMAPANLLSSLRKQSGRDDNGAKAFTHRILVDGPISVADVYSASTGWRTVGVIGQAQGIGLDQRSYYHAIDVTTPGDPQPLWEMTQGPSGGVRTCDPNPCDAMLCKTTPAPISVNIGDGDRYRSTMYLSTSTTDSAGRPYAYVLAQTFNAERQGLSPRRDWQVVTVTPTTNLYMESTTPVGTCSTSTYHAAQNCSELSYRVHVDAAAQGTYRLALQFRTNPLVLNTVAVGVDSKVVFSGTLSPAVPQVDTYQWTLVEPTFSLSAGEHTIRIYAVTSGVGLNALALVSPESGLPGSNLSSVLYEVDYLDNTTGSCDVGCLPKPNSSPWPACKNEGKCCSTATNTADAGDGTTPSSAQGFCQADITLACGNAPSSMGQTFSPPALGPVKTASGIVWAAFFGSGPVTTAPAVNQGRSVYMVNALTGAPMASWLLPPVAGSNVPPLGPVAAGGPVLVDADGDGYVDRLYIGDLSGRLWKINTHASVSLSGSGLLANPANYPACVVFDASMPEPGAARQWAPIITTPAVSIYSSGGASAPTPNIYFGTGGDALAPSTGTYSLFSVRDSDGLDACSNTAKVASQLTTARDEWQIQAPAGARFWTGATVVANSALYVAASTGVPDSVNPCAAASETSYVYGVAVTRFTDSAGIVHAAGTSLLSTGANYFTTQGLIRAAPTVRGITPSPVVRPASLASSKPTDVLLQQSSGTVLRLSTPGVTATGSLWRMQMVREVFR